MVVLGLGSNQGNREEYLQQAVQSLKNILADVFCSSVYESNALLPDNAPKEWDTAFLNMAVKGKTDLPPPVLLQEIQRIERSLGRISRGHWGPREIDIDILVYDDEVMNEAELIIPHKELLNRDFALIPLAEIQPSWIYPIKGNSQGKTALELSSVIAQSIHKTTILIR
jgi:2-amino-4-hydroxy-6-hydroxymethyldihydropteridine diphosphokinase